MALYNEHSEGETHQCTSGNVNSVTKSLRSFDSIFCDWCLLVPYTLHIVEEAAKKETVAMFQVCDYYIGQHCALAFTSTLYKQLCYLLLMACIDVIESTVLEHQHVGTWYLRCHINVIKTSHACTFVICTQRCSCHVLFT